MRRVDAAPAHQLRAPGDIGIFAIDKKVRIEELFADGNVFDHLAAVQSGGGGCAENIFVLQIMPVVHFLAAAIQMPQHGGEVDSRRIDQRFFRQIEAGQYGEQFPADGTDLGVELSGIHQRLNEIRQQQNIRIQSQYPIAVAGADGLVLRGGKSDVLVVVDNLTAVFELLQNVYGPVGRRVVDDDDFLVGIALHQDRFKASFDESTAVVGDDCDGNPIVTGHVYGSCLYSFFFSICPQLAEPPKQPGSRTRPVTKHRPAIPITIA